MGKVRTVLSVSLDGFISGLNDGAAGRHGGEPLITRTKVLSWALGSTDHQYRVSPQPAVHAANRGPSASRQPPVLCSRGQFPRRRSTGGRPAMSYAWTGRWPRYRGSLAVAGGRSHSDVWVGCTVWSTTASSSTVRVSRSTCSRSWALNASMVRAAS
jgi:hypothetical protein